MKRPLLTLLVCLAVGFSAGAQTTTRPAPRKIDVADGVYLFVTAPYGAVGLDGNSVVVTSNDGVLVFDSNGTPSAAAAVLTSIRALTSNR